MAQREFHLTVNFPGVEDEFLDEEKCQEFIDQLATHIPAACDEADIQTSQPASGTGGVTPDP